MPVDDAFHTQYELNEIGRPCSCTDDKSIIHSVNLGAYQVVSVKHPGAYQVVSAYRAIIQSVSLIQQSTCV